MRLTMKGLLIRREKRALQVRYYEMAKEIADKVGYAKHKAHKGSNNNAPLQELKDISELIGNAKISVDKGELQLTIEAWRN